MTTFNTKKLATIAAKNANRCAGSKVFNITPTNTTTGWTLGFRTVTLSLTK